MQQPQRTEWKTSGETEDGRFNGELKYENSYNHGDLTLFPIFFVFIFVQGKPSLLIGHHLLEGTIATLPKPFAVILRTGNPGPDLGDDAIVIGSPADHSVSSKWSVVGIVKKKIVFSKRPMPVM